MVAGNLSSTLVGLAWQTGSNGGEEGDDTTVKDSHPNHRHIHITESSSGLLCVCFEPQVPERNQPTTLPLMPSLHFATDPIPILLSQSEDDSFARDNPSKEMILRIASKPTTTVPSALSSSSGGSIHSSTTATFNQKCRKMVSLPQRSISCPQTITIIIIKQ